MSATTNERGSNPNRKPTLAIDFDGVIHFYRKGWQDGSIYDGVVPGAAWALAVLSHKFHIVIFSARSFSGFSYWGEHLEGQAPQIEAWLKEHGIPFDEVWTKTGKPSAVAYIDDRAICFRGDWGETIRELDNFRTWIDPTPQQQHEEIRALKKRIEQLEEEIEYASDTGKN